MHNVLKYSHINNIFYWIIQIMLTNTVHKVQVLG
jgi:hypothetical protein